MRRRDVIALVGGGAAAWRLIVHAPHLSPGAFIVAKQNGKQRREQCSTAAA
jgi:hypothetical protein